MDGAVEAVRGADPAAHGRLCDGVLFHVLPGSLQQGVQGPAAYRDF